jgi:hypothetical protein
MQVIMKKDELLAVLEKNHKEHLEFFEEANKNYLLKVEEAIQEVSRIFAATKKLDTEPLQISKPQSFSSQYSEAIEMVKFTEEALITLPQKEFRQYVLDKWDWMYNFYASNSAYLSAQSTTTLSSKAL